jgi:pimeloyl-ACP methyl ester carboxylesterase
MSILALALVSLGLVLPKKTVELSTGITMKYVEAGNPAGEAVILLHGITDSSRSFYPMMEYLVELRPDLRLFALDQRGHGGSSLPAASECRSAPERCFRPKDFAADVLAFMDARGIERAHIVGHSMSSAVAQELALDRPDRVLRLVVIAGFASAVGQSALRDYLLAGWVEGSWKDALSKKGYRFPEDVYELTPLDADPDVESVLRENWVFDPTADPVFITAVTAETARTPIGTWLGAARALLEFDARERLSELTVPILVLWPTQDAFFPYTPYQADLIAALDRAARLCNTSYVFKRYGTRPLPESGLQEDELGHNLQWGAPEGVALDLASWLRDRGRPTSDHFASDPENVRRVVSSKGEALLVERSARNCSTTEK